MSVKDSYLGYVKYSINQHKKQATQQKKKMDKGFEYALHSREYPVDQ